MKMYRSVRTFCGSLTLVAAIFALGGAGLGQSAYFTLTDLGRLPGHTRSEPAALNNLGIRLCCLKAMAYDCSYGLE